MSVTIVKFVEVNEIILVLQARLVKCILATFAIGDYLIEPDLYYHE